MSLTTTHRWRHLRLSARRLLGAVLRGRWAAMRDSDEWHNFWNLLLSRRRSRAHCPICDYRGPFLHFAGRPRQICASCGSRARHRTIRLTIDQWRAEGHDFAYQDGLHLAPEPFLEQLLAGYGDRLWTGDLEPGVGGIALDLRDLPFVEQSLDLLFASHVLEHIVEDHRVLSEIWRVLKPGGLAVLPVPVTATTTVDFGAVIPEQNYHARECGPDYFERYREAGFEVDLYRSDHLAEEEACALVTLEHGQRTIHWIPFCRKPA